MHRKLKIWTTVFVTVAAVGLLSASARAVEEVYLTPQQVLSRMHRVNLMAIEAAQLAKTQAYSNEVRNLAVDVAKLSKKWDKEVIALAKEQKVKLVEPTPLSETDREFMSHQNEVMARLRALKGKDFDREYLTALIARRENVLPYLKEIQPHIVDQRIKAFVTNAIPRMEQQLDTARTLQKREFGTP